MAVFMMSGVEVAALRVMSEEQFAQWRSDFESAAGCPPTSDELRREVARRQSISNFRRLQLACDGHGHPEVVRCFLEADAEDSADMHMLYQAALHLAAMNGHDEVEQKAEKSKVTRPAKQGRVVLDVGKELDARSARIWSKDNDRDKAMDAKEKIEEEMEDITTVDSLTVNVPANIVNQVINDSALRQLQDQTGLTANVCKNDQGTGIRLTGLSGAIQEAKGLIERRSSGEGAEFLALMPGLFQKLAPKKYADFQRDLGFLMQNSGAQVTIAEGSNRADFRGGPEEVRHAKSELQKILHFYFEQECDTIDLPPESVNWVAGDDDRELMRLQSAGAVIALDRSAATLWMCGNPRSVEQVRNRIRNSLQRWDREHAVIHLQSRQSAWAIIGSGGSTIRELQSSTQARIDVDADNQRVTISGREESVREAKGRIMEIIGSRGAFFEGSNERHLMMKVLQPPTHHPDSPPQPEARAAMTGAADEAA
ncbi:unnamed protein product [Effrenium voratum]|nr:unnamed protein product [Effrenium voratum]